MELKFYQNNGTEVINTRFNSVQEIINYYYSKRKNWPGANWGKWRNDFKDNWKDFWEK